MVVQHVCLIAFGRDFFCFMFRDIRKGALSGHADSLFNLTYSLNGHGIEINSWMEGLRLDTNVRYRRLQVAPIDTYFLPSSPTTTFLGMLRGQFNDPY